MREPGSKRGGVTNRKLCWRSRVKPITVCMGSFQNYSTDTTNPLPWPMSPWRENWRDSFGRSVNFWSNRFVESLFSEKGGPCVERRAEVRPRFRRRILDPSLAVGLAPNPRSETEEAPDDSIVLR